MTRLTAVATRSPILAHTAMSLLYFLLMAGTFNTLGVVLPLMIRDLGLDWSQAGMGFALLGVSCGLSSLVPAATIRRLGVPLTLAVGGVVLAGGFALLATAHGPRAYDAGTILLGVGFCLCGTVSGTHVIAQGFQRRSTAIGLYFTLGGLGSVFGPLLFLATQHVTTDWRSFWWLLAAAAIVCGLFAAIATAGTARSQAADAPAADGWSVRDALAAPHYWVVVLAYTGCLLINTTLHNFAAQHVGERGLSPAAVDGLMSAVALVSCGASIAAGRLGERMSAKALTLAALAVLGVSATVLMLPQSAATLALFALGFGSGLGISYVATAMLLLRWFGRRPNLELYSVMCVVSTLAALGPAMGGEARQLSGSFTGVFGMLAAIAAALFVALALTRAPDPARRPTRRLSPSAG